MTACSCRANRHAPDHSAIELALHHARIDDPAGGKRADQPGDAHLSEIGIDLDLGKHGAVRSHGIACLSRRVGGALPLSLDLVKSGTTEDLGIAFAAALVVAAEQAATARNHAGITGAK
jgi:hypothetical protein